MAEVKINQPIGSPSASTSDVSSLSPFLHTAFTVLWIATVLSNVGTWMQSATAGWLMTDLDPDPFVVSLVQVATSLPMFLLALPAGALADIVDRRRLLIVIQTTVAVLVAAFGLLVGLGRVTPTLLLAFTFLAGAASSPHSTSVAIDRSTIGAATAPATSYRPKQRRR